jgi:hypothetical protein
MCCPLGQNPYLIGKYLARLRRLTRDKHSNFFAFKNANALAYLSRALVTKKKCFKFWNLDAREAIGIMEAENKQFFKDWLKKHIR